MQVLYVAGMDSAGQGQLLTYAMRRFLGWEARILVQRGSYLGYKSDWVASGEGFDITEVENYVKGTDFVIFQDLPLRFIDEKSKREFDLSKLQNPQSMVIHGLGTPMRANLQQLRSNQMNGMLVAAPMSDPTIYPYLVGGVPFEAVMVDVNRIEDIIGGINRRDKLTVVTAPTKEMKGESSIKIATDHVKHKFVGEGFDVDFISIKNTPWEETQRIKAGCHVLVDSLGDSSYGLNCLESLLMGHTVISNISPWCYALHPDLPMMSINPFITKRLVDDGLPMVLDEAITQLREKDGIAKDRERQVNKAWVKRHFDPEIVVKKWSHYINWALNREDRGWW
jgi:hypothetical protein